MKYLQQLLVVSAMVGVFYLVGKHYDFFNDYSWMDEEGESREGFTLLSSFERVNEKDTVNDSYYEASLLDDRRIMNNDVRERYMGTNQIPLYERISPDNGSALLPELHSKFYKKQYINDNN